MTTSTNSRNEYIRRIQIVQDHIDRHYCEELNLDILAEVSGFSKYHFHRIFSSLVGETLNSYIGRLRLEKAAIMILKAPEMSITEIAFDTGFSDTAVFARAFKNYFGISATQLRKNGKLVSKPGKASSQDNLYNDSQIKSFRRLSSMNLKHTIETIELEEMTVVYLRHTGKYEEMSQENKFQQMIQKLITWAGPRNLLNPETFRLLSVYHDNHEITDGEKLRTSVCIAVPKDTKVDGEFGKMTIPGGNYAVGHFSLTDGQQHSQAWEFFYSEWLPNSGCQPADGFNFEMYMNDPNTDPEGKHLIDIYMPIRELN